MKFGSIFPLGTIAISISLLPISLARAEENLYGKLNLSLVNTSVNESDEWKLNSNASRIGFTGKRSLSDKLLIHYSAEFEIYADDGNKTTKNTICSQSINGDESCLVGSDKTTFSQRNITIGISNNLGKLWAGKRDTPTKVAQTKIDLFNDLEGDIKNTFEGENRVSNMIGITTSRLNGLEATLVVVPGEGNDANGDRIDDGGLADGVGYSLNYTGDNIYLAIAGDKEIDNQDLLRLVARYRIDALTLGFMHQKNKDNGGTLDEKGPFLSKSFTIGNTVLKAQYGRVTGNDSKEEETVSMGADYKITKDTKFYGFYTENRDFDGSNDKQQAIGIGIEQKF